MPSAVAGGTDSELRTWRYAECWVVGRLPLKGVLAQAEVELGEAHGAVGKPAALGGFPQGDWPGVTLTPLPCRT